ncbi:MAG: Rieske (2Fe-2S) protein [Polyangiaceae bacterium]
MGDTFDLGPVAHIPPGEGRTFEVRGRLVAVFRTRAGELYATQASCPHRGGPLADGLLGERCVVCPLHGARFDLATGEPLGHHACEGIATYPVTIDHDERIHLRVSAWKEAS